MSEVATVVSEPTGAIVTTDQIDAAITGHASDTKFFTTNAQDLCAAQGKMSAWTRMKISELNNEMLELQTEHDIALKNKWRAGPWRKQMNMLAKRIDYYTKIGAAVDAGYVIVPVMPMDVFAVRVKVGSRPSSHNTTWSNHNESFQAETGMQALGAGEYVSDQNEVRQYETTSKDSQGREQKITNYYATGYGDIAFPLDVAKPVVMEATAAAMAMKVFDEVGVVRDGGVKNRRGDPFVIARIRDPRPNRTGLCFFIGWFIDVSAL